MKITKKIIAIYAIIAAVLVIFTLALPFPKPAVSWVAFAFGLASLAGGCAITLYAFGKSDSFKSKIYGLPVYKIGIIYTIAQNCVTIILYILASFLPIPYWIGLAISLIIMCIAAVGVIGTDIARDYIQEVDEKAIIQTKNMENLYVDIAEVLDICKNADAYAPLKKLTERFKFSDVTSSSETADIENQMKAEIEELRGMITSEDTEAILSKIDNISNLLSSRNRRCENAKRH